MSCIYYICFLNRQQMQLLLEEHNKKRQLSLREYQSWKDRKDAELILQRTERGISHKIHTPHRGMYICTCINISYDIIFSINSSSTWILQCVVM